MQRELTKALNLFPLFLPLATNSLLPLLRSTAENWTMKYSSFQGDRGEKGDKVRCSFVREHISSSSFHASFLSSSSFLSSPPFPFLLHPLLPLSLHLFLPFLPINLFRSYFIPPQFSQLHLTTFLLPSIVSDAPVQSNSLNHLLTHFLPIRVPIHRRLSHIFRFHIYIYVYACRCTCRYSFILMHSCISFTGWKWFRSFHNKQSE